jgi:hypothetical protein
MYSMRPTWDDEVSASSSDMKERHERSDTSLA